MKQRISNVCMVGNQVPKVRWYVSTVLHWKSGSTTGAH